MPQGCVHEIIVRSERGEAGKTRLLVVSGARTSRLAPVPEQL